MQTLLGGLRISEGLEEIVSFRSGALKPEPVTMMQSQYAAVLRNRRKGADKRNPVDPGYPGRAWATSSPGERCLRIFPSLRPNRTLGRNDCGWRKGRS